MVQECFRDMHSDRRKRRKKREQAWHECMNSWLEGSVACGLPEGTKLALDDVIRMDQVYPRTVWIWRGFTETLIAFQSEL